MIPGTKLLWGALLLCLLLPLVFPLFRQSSYELFLRSHQVLALASAYAAPSFRQALFPRLYIYIAVGFETYYWVDDLSQRFAQLS